MYLHHLDPSNRKDIRRYIQFPFTLYRASSTWVPPILNDVRAQLDPQRHPFYQHSEAAFFLALNGREVVGRIAVLDNAHHNAYHEHATAFFYHFDVINDRRVSRLLFDAAFEWARDRGLTHMWGPKGFMALDGQGVLVEGFEHPAAMGIPYNYPYYDDLLRDAGFEKQLDFISSYIDREMGVPERFLRVAEKVKQRQHLRSVHPQSKDELRAWIPRVAAVYNESFVEVQGYTPITELEAKAIGEQVLAIADPSLITLLLHEDELVGFVLAYPDITPALQRCRGKLWPLGWYHIWRELKRTRRLNFNGVAIKEAYRGLGGNALLYAELYNTIIPRPRYQSGELVQVQETNARMVKELEALGVSPYKRHRVYHRSLV